MDPFTRGGGGDADLPPPPPTLSGDSTREPTGALGWTPPSGARQEGSGYQRPPAGRASYGAGYAGRQGLGVPPAGRTPGYGYQPSSTHGTYGQPNPYPQYGGYPSYQPGGYWGPPPAPRRSGARTAMIAIAIVAGVAILVLGFGGGIGAALYVHNAGQTPGTPAGSGRGGGGGNGGSGNGGASGSIDLKTLGAKLDPAIVDISGVEQNASGQTVTEDAGTGVIISADGKVMTNNHVIEGDEQLQATLANGDTDRLKVLGEDPTDDVALVQIQGASNLPAINIENGAVASLSQAVAAFGNALGKGGVPTATAGTVTSLNQTITASLDGTGKSETLTGMIEMSAQICPGDSGGVLADQRGRYLGILTAAAASNGGGGSGNPGYGGGSGGSGGSGQNDCSNDGFVIPAAHAAAIVKQIEAGKRTSKVIIGVPGFLGVEVQECTDASAQQGTCQPPAVNGAQVTQLVQGGAAAQAGLPQTFVITAVNGAPIATPDDLTAALDQTSPGTVVQLAWNDGQGGPMQTTSVTLGSGPPA
ncbi:MAG: trypsin-like peptidase domain-containing protein [Candidatus Dormibacteraceae bacterium]